MSFWCITTLFNPCQYPIFLENYLLFSTALKKQGANLLTVETVFGDNSYSIPSSENVLKLKSNSVLWLKERMINYAVSQLPSSCKYVAWLDADILFSRDNWIEVTIEKLKTANVVQLFDKMYYLPQGVKSYSGERYPSFSSIVQQAMKKNWIEFREIGRLSFAAPGFAWAARKEWFDGLYDKVIVGSGDTFFVDNLLNSWVLHGFTCKYNEELKRDMEEWSFEFRKKNTLVDYVPGEIYHLWHGNLNQRNYIRRHDILNKFSYDPKKDIVLLNNVYEWASNKPEMHRLVKEYFTQRKDGG